MRFDEGGEGQGQGQSGGTSRVFLGPFEFPGMGHTSPKACGITAMHSHAVVGENVVVVVVDRSMVSV